MKWGITCFFENRHDFAMIAELGSHYPVEYIEIRGEHPFFAPEVLTDIDLKFFQDVIARSGLKVTLHATFYDINLATINTYLQDAVLKCYKKYIDLANMIDAQIMAVHAGHIYRDAVNVGNLFETARENLIDNLKILGDYAEKKNVTIGLENSPPGPRVLMVPHWKDHLEILKQVNHPYVKALYDTAHAHLHGLDIVEYYRKIQHDLVELHVHNNNGREDEHRAMGDGTINYQEFFRKNQITVPVIMEIRSLSEAKESLEWIKQFEL